MDFDTLYRALGGSGPVYRRLVMTAFGGTEDIGQQGLTVARDIQLLARGLGIGPGMRLLDVCCGPGGPGRVIGRALGCRVFGLDHSQPALRLASLRSGAAHRLVAADALQLPFRCAGFEAALVLDSLSAFGCPPALFRELARVLVPNGRLGLTAEVGNPLGHAELIRMPPGPAYVFSERVLRNALEDCGFRLVMTADRTSSAALIARRLAQGLTAARAELSKEIGPVAVRDLTASLQTWGDLLSCRRVHELMMVAELGS